MTGLGIQDFNFALLLLTAYLSIQAHIFQIRTSIRESLEQLDDYEYAFGSVQLNALLRRFNYRSRWSESEVLIKWRNPGQTANSSRAHGNAFWWLSAKKREEFCRAVENLKKVSGCNSNNDAIWFTVESKNPVTVRRKVETIYRLIETAYENKK
jgi:hypothetical protein